MASLLTPVGSAPSRFSKYALTATALLLLTLSALTTAQTQPNQQNLCSSRFEAALAPECFQTYGVNFTGVIYVLSGNRSGEIPNGYTYQSFLEFLCSVNMQDKIIPCVLKQMQKYNSTQCTQEDRVGVLGRGGQLLAFMDAICGESCEQESTQSLIQCYAAINVNPEPILNQNASIADDKYSIVGANESEYDNFCANRQKLFSCLSPLPSTCPGLLKRMYTIGIDLNAMEAATGLLCGDKQRYFKGLTCFSTPSQQLNQCTQTTSSNMRTALIGRYQTGTIAPSQYMDKLCETKLTQVDCELSAYAKTCDKEVTTLRTTVECSMLPKPCREKQQFQAAYNGICQTITTPSPAQTVRPTQSQPGEVPVGGGSKTGGGSSSSSSSRGSSGNADNGAATSGLPITLMVLAALVGVVLV